MKITEVEAVVLAVPFSEAAGRGSDSPTDWSSLDFTLVRVATDAGLTGWGEAFGYFTGGAAAAVIRHAIAPLLVGRDPSEAEAINDELQRRLHLGGRYGITTFAISGVDIALWDLKAKAEGVPLAALLGETRRRQVPAYASLVRYGEAGALGRAAERALAEGYGMLKLHEIRVAQVAACRQAVGPEVALTLDVNCAWSAAETDAALDELRALDLAWLEEPTFPPEDFATLSRLRGQVPLASGENLCTAVQFAAMIEAAAVDIVQPSVTKVGGITEFRKVMALAADAGVRLVPHSPYFGPGYLATLQLMAAMAEEAPFELLYIRPQAWLYAGMPLPEGGRVVIPDGPGLGMDPDREVLERYRARGESDPPTSVSRQVRR